MKRSIISALLLGIFFTNVISQTVTKDSSTFNFEKAQIKNSSVQNFFSQYVGFPPDLLPGSENQNVVISFIIQKDGQIDSIKIIKDPSKSATYATLEALEKSVGRWIPTKINGIPIDKKYYVSFNYLFSNEYSNIIRKANNLLKKGDNEKALKTINEALNFNEFDIELYQIRSQIYNNLDKVELENDDLKKIETLKKDLLIIVWIMEQGVKR